MVWGTINLFAMMAVTGIFQIIVRKCLIFVFEHIFGSMGAIRTRIIAVDYSKVRSLI